MKKAIIFILLFLLFGIFIALYIQKENHYDFSFEYQKNYIVNKETDTLLDLGEGEDYIIVKDLDKLQKITIYDLKDGKKEQIFERMYSQNGKRYVIHYPLEKKENLGIELQYAKNTFYYVLNYNANLDKYDFRLVK